MSKPICVIPARMASSRFPGKPLATLLGMALIVHVFERCKLYPKFSDVIVANRDSELLLDVRSKVYSRDIFGGDL